MGYFGKVPSRLTGKVYDTNNTVGSASSILTSDASGNVVWSSQGSSQWVTTSAGIHTLSNVGIGTTVLSEKLTIVGSSIISNISPTTVSYAASTPVFVSNASDIAFSNDGYYYYFISSGSIVAKRLLVPWSTSRGYSDYGDSLSVMAQSGVNGTAGLFIKPDGTKLYHTASSTTFTGAVYQYTFGIPWNIDTLSYDVITYPVGSEYNNLNGLFFKPDGTSMYIIGSESTTIDRIYQYNLTTPWEINTAGISTYKNVGPQDTSPAALSFSADGSQLLVLGAQGSDVNFYTLSTPWQVDTANFVGVITTLPSGATGFGGMYWRSDAKKLYISSNNRIFEYNITSSGTQTVQGSLEVFGDVECYNTLQSNGLLDCRGTSLFSGPIIGGGSTIIGTASGIITALSIDSSISNILMHVGTSVTTGLTVRTSISTVRSNNYVGICSVGISTTHPRAALHVVPNSESVAALFAGSMESDIVRITQLGTGNALVVEDETNPDSSPFVVGAAGSVGIGTAIPQVKLEIASDNTSQSNTLRFTDLDNFTTNDQQVGKIEFFTNDTSAPGPGVKAYIGAFAESATPNVYLSFATHTGSGTSLPTERVRISASGNVGIGSTLPGAKLNVVNDTASDTVRITTVGTGNALVVEDSTNPDATPFVINSGGNVGIGTLTLTARLNVTESSTSDAVRITQLGTGYALIVEDSATPDTTSFVVTGDGNVGVATFTPTARLHIAGGTATAGTSPLEISSGTLLTTPESDVFEYDGTLLYHTQTDITNGNKRALIPEVQFFRRTTNLSITGSTLPGTNVFSVGPALLAGNVYEIEAVVFLQKVTNAGVSTIQASLSTGNFTFASLQSSTSAAAVAVNGTTSPVTVFTSASLTAATNYGYTVKGLVQPVSNARFNLLASTSTTSLTIYSSSYIKATCVGTATSIGNIA